MAGLTTFATTLGNTKMLRKKTNKMKYKIVDCEWKGNVKIEEIRQIHFGWGPCSWCLWPHKAKLTYIYITMSIICMDHTGWRYIIWLFFSWCFSNFVVCEMVTKSRLFQEWLLPVYEYIWSTARAKWAENHSTRMELDFEGNLWMKMEQQ